MIFFKVYNDDKLRSWNGFPTMKDPMVLENTLLKIINMIFELCGIEQEKSFNILNPKFYNMYFTYYTSSNFNAWGTLPLGYIYNDMIRHIQNRNSNSNFIMTMESIEFTEMSCQRKAYSGGNDPTDMTGEIVSAYIVENYLASYRYIENYNNGILVIRVPDKKSDSCIYYIISVGFDPEDNVIWLSTDKNTYNPGSLTYGRYKSLVGIVTQKGYLTSITSTSSEIFYESAEGKSRENIGYCKNLLSHYDIAGLKKKSEYDTETKYGNYPIDYDWLDTYDKGTPGMMFSYTDKTGSTYLINKFNQDAETRVDYRLLKKENDLIKISEKKSGIG